MKNQRLRETNDPRPMILNEYMTPSLARAARAILNWSMADLARRTGVAATTIRNYESGKRGTTRVNRAAIAAAFLEEGIEFVGGDAPGPGLILRRAELLSNPPPTRPHSVKLERQRRGGA